jgi:hypothetical protein
MKQAFFTLLGLLLISATSTASELKDTMDSLPASEPVKCYKAAWGSKDTPGIGLTAGQAVTLCGGTDDAEKTILCFVQAWSHPNNGGLGITAGQAVALCKSNSLQ